MGHDEHGPAYPEPYRCPVCRGDENCYLTCDHPGCFDGRDRDHPHARARAEIARVDRERRRLVTCAPRDPVWPWFLADLFLIGFVLGYLLMSARLANAMDHGFNPDSTTTKWFESLQRPDRPGSCCGKGDAYPVTYAQNPDGSAEVTVTDPSDKVYPDHYHRPAYNGGVIHVPKDLVNKLDDDLGNPTDTSWIFMSVYAGEVGSIYCLIRHPDGN